MTSSGEFRYHLTGVTSIDAVGFRERRRGHEVRDCILVLDPGPKTRLGLLTRSGMDGTVHEEMVRHGRGSIDIDGSRVVSSGDHKRPFQPTRNERNVYGEQTGFMPTNADGRFPTNLILRHGPGCECVGMKKVQSQNPAYKQKGIGKGGYMEGWQGRPKDQGIGYAGEDGKENVADWVCQFDCPVPVLDAQSGTSKSGPLQPDGGRGWNSHSMHGSGQNAPQGYGDTGGASRFFRHVTTETELEAYLQNLVRSA